jgi:peptidoglycan biosynthesis protein MviN/MurJ (putative lipid II flippase)
MGVFGVALSTAALPKLAAFVARGDQPEFQKSLAQGYSWSLILGVGSAAGLYFFAEPILMLIYERGSFSAQDTLQSAKALRAYAFGLVAFNLAKIFTQAYYARSRLWLPGFVSLLAIVSNYLLNDFLVSKMGHVGLAATTSLVAWVGVVILGLGLWKSGWHPFAKSQWRLVAGLALGCAGLGWLSHEGLGKVLMDSRAGGLPVYWMINSLGLFGAGVVYLGLISLVTHEGRALVRALTRRFRS